MTEAHRLSNGDSEIYWESVQEGRLLLQSCGACGAMQFPPRHHCASCWNEDLDWVESTGQGVVESFTIVRRAPLPAFRDKVPYAVVAVTLAEGPRMIASMTGEGALDLSIGETVAVTFETDDAGTALPKFRRT